MGHPIPRLFSFSTCFVCGPDNAHGLGLVFERQGDSITATFTAPMHLGGYGTILHGGITSTLLDEAMAWAVYGLLERLSLTTEMTVKFIGPVRCGDALSVTGAITSSDRRGAAARAELRDSTGVVRATATGTMRFVSMAVAERLALGK